MCGRSDAVRPTVLAAVVCAGLLMCSTSWADGGGVVRGNVVDRDDQPVAKAVVSIVDSPFRTSTDVDGSFELAAVPPGSYRIEAVGEGFAAAATVSVTIADGTTTEVVFRLDPVPLREVVVTSSVSILREEPIARVSLDRKQITELPHFGDDLFRAVSVLPGTSGSDISARFSVRGGLDDETLVRMDQMELFEPYHLKDFQGIFSIFDPEMVGGVDLHPGGFSAEYGDRMSGVLDMTSRVPVNTHGGIGISFTNAWVNSGGVFADGRGRWLASVRRGYLDVILNMVDDGGDDERPPDPRYWDAFAMMGYDPSQLHSLTLQVLVADDTLIFEEDDDVEFVDVSSGYGSQYMWLRHQGVVSGSSFVNSSLYGGSVSIERDFLGFDYAAAGERFELDDHRQMDLYGIRSDWQHELSGRHYLRWGFEVRSYDARYDYENASLIEDPIDDPRFEPGTRLTSFHDNYRGEWYGVYATDRIRVGKRWAAELGVRFDKQTLTNDEDVSPRINLLYNIGSTGVLRLGWGHFHQTQRPYELDVQFGETEFLPAQRAENWTLGFETEIGRNHRFRVNAYLQNVENPLPRWETLFDPFSPVPEFATDLVRLAPESVTGQGVEVYLASRRGGRFDWWMSYSYASIEDELHGVGTPRFVDQTHAFTASASWRPGPKWSFTAVWTYHTGWPATSVAAWWVQQPDGDWVLNYDVGPFYQERLDDYHRLDIRASRSNRVGKRGTLTFFVDVQNVYNRENLRGIAIADPQWSFDEQQGWRVTFPEEYWLPIIPSFGVSWQF